MYGEVTMDSVDRTVVELLQQDASIAQAEIARRVGLSLAATNERIRKLEKSGLVKGYVALVDDEKVGLDVTAFVEVFIEHPKEERGFLDLVLSLHEVMECHYVTGEFSCLLKVRVKDRHALRELVLDRINALPGVRQTRTVIVLKTVKESPRVALPPASKDGRRRREPNLPRARKEEPA